MFHVSSHVYCLILFLISCCFLVNKSFTARGSTLACSLLHYTFLNLASSQWDNAWWFCHIIKENMDSNAEGSQKRTTLGSFAVKNDRNRKGMGNMKDMKTQTIFRCSNNKLVSRIYSTSVVCGESLLYVLSRVSLDFLDSIIDLLLHMDPLLVFPLLSSDRTIHQNGSSSIPRQHAARQP